MYVKKILANNRLPSGSHVSFKTDIFYRKVIRKPSENKNICVTDISSFPLSMQ